jgi:phage/conjugal plasmid C-4 type zinc finger TraR family protein
MDIADLAEIELDLMERERQDRIARMQFRGKSRTHCAECDVEIPQRRQELVPGVRLCFDCAEIKEARHA